MSRREPYSALTTTQWADLHRQVFDGDSEALSVMHDWARGNYQPPIGTVIMSALWALSSLPAGTTFNAGIGNGCLNTLVALVGRPGQGKDSLAARVAGNLQIVQGALTISPVEASLGSGEGVAARCAPDAESGGAAEPVIFGESEAGRMETLMNRQGSTLRQTIMSIYSGNQLGTSNKNEATYVPRNTYTAGLWVGVQPDKAGALLGGADDGLAHRFIWTELLDPGHTTPDDVPQLLPVVIPADIGRGFTYPQEVISETRANSRNTLMFGAEGDHMGHRHQTRLKLAAGLALLRSTREVNSDDWRRAGALMDYSDTVRQWCLRHMEEQNIASAAERLERRDQADDQVHRNRVRRNRRRILEALADDSSEDAVKWSPLIQARPNRERGSMNEALQELVNSGAVSPVFDHQGHTESLTWGAVFTDACDREGVSYVS